MLKQKTVAKWLAVILLLTIAVGSYLLYDAVFKEVDVQADADGNDGADAPDDKSDALPETPPHIPFYTSLPRESEIIGNAVVSHVGGEGDDEFLSAVAFGENEFVFFNSNSEEYDLREKGLHLALFRSGSLKSVDKISNGEFLDAKLCAKGVAVAVKEEENVTLYLYSTDGALIAKTAIENADDFKFYLYGDTLCAFYVSNGYLRFSEYLDCVKEQRSPYLVSTHATEINAVLYIGGKFLVATSTNDGLKGYTFEQNKGFILSFSIDNLRFKQIECVGGVDSTILLLLENGEESALVSLKDFGIDNRKSIEEKSVVIAKSEDGFDLIASGKTYTFCKHLDLISSKDNSFSFDEISAFAPYKNGVYFISKKDGKNSLCSSADGVLVSLPDSLINPAVSPKAESVGIYSSSSSSVGVTRANFGEYDVFSFTYPR